MRRRLLALRRLVFETAAATRGVGALEETLKWGEPAYVTSESKSGSTVRIGWKKARPQQYAMYFHCQTNLVDTFRTVFPSELRYEGRRAIVFDAADTVPMDALALCIAAALTYHRRKALIWLLSVNRPRESLCKFRCDVNLLPDGERDGANGCHP